MKYTNIKKIFYYKEVHAQAQLSHFMRLDQSINPPWCH